MLNKLDVINHKVFGVGVVVKIEYREDGPRLLHIKFENEPQTIRRFTDESIKPFLK